MTNGRRAAAFVVSLWRDDPRAARVAIVHAALGLATAVWDVPSSFTWECDAIAPRDLFSMLASNLTPGSGHNYPLLHALVLVVISLPFTLLALVRSLVSGGTVKDAVLAPLTMTGISASGKLVSIVMSSLTLLVLARLARRLFASDAGWLAALLGATLLPFAYYGRTTNLDVPYLFWTLLAFERLVAALDGGSRRDYLLTGAFTAASLATKDQAYASYVVPALVYVLALPLVRPPLAAAGRAHFRYVGAAALAFVGVYGLASPALLNPTGFWYRVQLLRGANSQDWRSYDPTLDGALQNALDLARSLPELTWPWPVLALVALGLVLAPALRIGNADARTRLLRWLPACAAVSSLLAFTLVVGRGEARFVLPAALFVCIPAAGGLAVVGRAGRGALLGLATCIALFGGLRVLALSFTQWGDARRELEQVLAREPTGTRVETYGKLVYQPRFDVSPHAPYRVARIDTVPKKKRNPLPGVTELDAPFGAVRERAPDLLVLQGGWAHRFLPTEKVGKRRIQVVRARALGDDDATSFFRAAMAGSLPGYRLERVLEPAFPKWLHALGQRPVRIHGSTGEPVWLLRRVRS